MEIVDEAIGQFVPHSSSLLNPTVNKPILAKYETWYLILGQDWFIGKLGSTADQA